ncbi:jg23986 [Pararge aegeria aegeria]|uniref:Jg23986 protein n=1 Tax=Pararge aegeria aegeria TaxID=348720 RepID=A0A8S4QGJ3_9NEOP|nr:jg23986 [Pararge aegeria aegeria]
MGQPSDQPSSQFDRSPRGRRISQLRNKRGEATVRIPLAGAATAVLAGCGVEEGADREVTWRSDAAFDHLATSHSPTAAVVALIQYMSMIISRITPTATDNIGQSGWDEAHRTLGKSWLRNIKLQAVLVAWKH